MDNLAIVILLLGGGCLLWAKLASAHPVTPGFPSVVDGIEVTSIVMPTGEIVADLNGMGIAWCTVRLTNITTTSIAFNFIFDDMVNIVGDPENVWDFTLDAGISSYIPLGMTVKGLGEHTMWFQINGVTVAESMVTVV